MLIHLGYEIGTGEPVAIPLHHLVVTGLTQASGKTTTLWALLTRLPDGFRALAFRTKRGELEFEAANVVPPFFREKTDWRYVESLLEAAMKERMKFERSWIIRACKGARTLRHVYRNITKELQSGRRLRGLDESVWTNLQAYFDEVLPQLEENPFSDTLVLAPGANVMNLGHLSEEVQALVISSCLEYLSEKESDVVVVIPEAWQFVPQRRGGPVKWAAQRVIRMGAVVHLLMWLDSQDVTGIEKSILKSVGTWLLGRQMELNEVKRVIDQLPTRERPRPEDVMTLKVGHFYAASDTWCRLVYVQPAWLSDDEARQVATGGMEVPTPPPQTEAEEDPMVIKELEEKVSFLSMRVEDLTRDRAQLQETVETLGNRLSETAASLEEKSSAAEHAMKAMADAEKRLMDVRRVFGNLLDLLRLDLPAGQDATATVDIDQVVARVLERLPADTRAIQATPPEALKHQFQKEALARLQDEIKALDPRQRRVIAWLEQKGDVTSTPQLALHVEGKEFQRGGRYVVEFSRMLRGLATAGLIAGFERQGYAPALKVRVRIRLEPYAPNEEQIEAVYQHLLYLLAQEGER